MAAAMTQSSNSVFDDNNSNNGNGNNSINGGGSAFNLDTIFGALKAATPNLPTPDRQLEYLFEDEYVSNGPSWGARICYGSGITYLMGLGVGGSWGLIDGLRNPAGITTRLRINCILNSCTARGPFVANNMAILALLYNLIHGGVIRTMTNELGESEVGKWEGWSQVGSATLAGCIYKSTKGWRVAGKTGGLFGTGMLAFQLIKKYYNQQLN